MKYYFRSDVLVVPYVMNWYAWPELIPPATLAANVVKKYIPIMEKFINNPTAERAKANDLKLLGGPYIDLPPENVKDIVTMLETIKTSEFLELYSSLQKCNQMVLDQASGDSMSELYNKVPDLLKGMVELVYDSNGAPHIRLIEPLFYHKWYNSGSQSIMFSEIKEDFRTYSLRNTPLVEKDDQVKINIPFSDEALDQLFASRYVGCSYTEAQKLCAQLNLDESFIEKYFVNNFIAKENNNYTGSDVRVRYFGHACILIQSKNISILIDPIISYDFKGADNRYTLSDLPDQIDYVLLTHKHMDHFAIETLIQIRHKVKNVVVPHNNQGALVDPSMKLILKNLGFKSIICLNEFDAIECPNGFIHAVPFIGEHSDLNITSKLAYLVDIADKRMFFAVDIDNVESEIYNNIFKYYSAVDLMFIGMECEGAPCSWLYGPLLGKPLKDEHNTKRTLKGSNANQALAMVDSTKCREVYIYAMGLEPWLSHIMGISYQEDTPQIVESNYFIEKCKQKSVMAERLNFIKEWVL